ncbi:hypothetical protein, partial [Mycoplasma marinum]
MKKKILLAANVTAVSALSVSVALSATGVKKSGKNKNLNGKDSKAKETSEDILKKITKDDIDKAIKKAISDKLPKGKTLDSLDPKDVVVPPQVTIEKDGVKVKVDLVKDPSKTGDGKVGWKSTNISTPDPKDNNKTINAKDQKDGQVDGFKTDKQKAHDKAKKTIGEITKDDIDKAIKKAI